MSKLEAFKAELAYLDANFPMKDHTFLRRADNEATKILAKRIGRQPRFPEDMGLFEPGDLRKAAERVNNNGNT